LILISLLVGAWAYKRLTKDPTQMKAMRTPLTLDQARAHFRTAFQRVFSRDPSPEEEGVLLAQSAHETARWQKMWNYNWGGLKAVGGQAKVTLNTTEGFGANARRLPQNFAAYGNATEGSSAWLGLLSRRYQEALERAAAGDPGGYARALNKRGYFTGNADAYARSLERLYPEMHPQAGEDVAVAMPASSPADIKVIASIPGWRRARPNEVTPEMVAAAREALKEPLGAVVDHGHFRVALEEHYWPEKGVHKGATVFLPAEV